MASRLFLARLIPRSARIRLPAGGGSRDCALTVGAGGGFPGAGQVGRNCTLVEPAGRSSGINPIAWFVILGGVSGVCYFHIKLPANYRREQAELNKVIEDGKQKIESLEAQIAAAVEKSHLRRMQRRRNGRDGRMQRLRNG